MVQMCRCGWTMSDTGHKAFANSQTRKALLLKMYTITYIHLAVHASSPTYSV